MPRCRTTKFKSLTHMQQSRHCLKRRWRRVRQGTRNLNDIVSEMRALDRELEERLTEQAEQSGDAKPDF